MTQSAKEGLITLGVAVGVLFLFSLINKQKDTVSKTGKKKYIIPEPDPSMENNPQAMDAYAVLCAYIEAYNDGMDSTFLSDLNAEFKKEMGLSVYENADGTISVEDASGKEILVSQQMA